MYLIPAAATQRFSSVGDNAVISITLDAPSQPETMVSVMTILQPIHSDLESAIDSVPPIEIFGPPSPEMETERLDRDPGNAPSQPHTQPVSLNVPPTDRPKLRRREAVPKQPEVISESASYPDRSIITENRPEVVLSNPLKQWAGLEKETEADFSENRPPSYPSQAVRQKLQGVVMLRLSVSKTGNVEKVEVVESSGHSILDQAAISAVGKWKGKPASRWGRATASTEILPIRFRI